MDNPIVLQSGYITIPNSSYVIDPDTDKEVNLYLTTKYDNILPVTKLPYAYHKTITNLYIKYVNNSLISNDFEFLSEFIAALKDAMNGMNWNAWCKMQTENLEFMDQIHIDFLKQVIAVFSNPVDNVSVPWNIGPEAWADCIYGRPVLVPAKSQLEELSKEITYIQQNTTFADGVAAILRGKDGIKKLVYIGGIIFSQRNILINGTPAD